MFMYAGSPEPDLSTWEGRMAFRAAVRREIAALTEPPAEVDWEAGLGYWPMKDGPGYAWTEIDGPASDYRTD